MTWNAPPLAPVPDAAPPATQPADAPPPPPTAADILRRLGTLPPQKTYSTPWPDLDALLCGGFWARQVSVIVAPPGSGKTGLVGGIAVKLTDDLPVLWVAAELDDEEQSARLAALALGVPPVDILAGRMAPAAAADAIRDLPVYVFELDVFATPDPIGAIEARARAITAVEGRAPAIVVDYLQALDVDTGDRRRSSVGLLAYRLRRLARQLDVPVVAISSTSRAFYGPRPAAGEQKNAGPEDPRAWLSAAKESGDVEFAAAVVGYLETAPQRDGSGTPARLIMAKVRRGRVGFVGLSFDGPTGRFSPSEGALARMGAAAKQEQDDALLLKTVASKKDGAPAWRQLRAACGLGATRADAALERLCSAGKLVQRFVKETDGDGRLRGQARALVVLAEHASDPLPIGLAEVPR